MKNLIKEGWEFDGGMSIIGLISFSGIVCFLSGGIFQCKLLFLVGCILILLFCLSVLIGITVEDINDRIAYHRGWRNPD